MIGKGATPSFFAIANDNYTLTILQFVSCIMIKMNKSLFNYNLLLKNHYFFINLFSTQN